MKKTRDKGGSGSRRESDVRNRVTTARFGARRSPGLKIASEGQFVLFAAIFKQPTLVSAHRLAVPFAQYSTPNSLTLSHLRDHVLALDEASSPRLRLAVVTRPLTGRSTTGSPSSSSRERSGTFAYHQAFSPAI